MATESVHVVELPTLSPQAATGGTRKLGNRVDLLQQLKVRVSLSLGTTELPVQELFALEAGHVVALKERADAPVELHVDGKLVARGVLVAAGDRLGVRISELAVE